MLLLLLDIRDEAEQAEQEEGSKESRDKKSGGGGDVRKNMERLRPKNGEGVVRDRNKERSEHDWLRAAVVTEGATAAAAADRAIV